MLQQLLCLSAVSCCAGIQQLFLEPLHRKQLPVLSGNDVEERREIEAKQSEAAELQKNKKQLAEKKACHPPEVVIDYQAQSILSFCIKALQQQSNF